MFVYERLGDSSVVMGLRCSVRTEQSARRCKEMNEADLKISLTGRGYGSRFHRWMCMCGRRSNHWFLRRWEKIWNRKIGTRMTGNKEKEVLRISKKGMEHEKMEMAHVAHGVLHAAFGGCAMAGASGTKTTQGVCGAC